MDLDILWAAWTTLPTGWPIKKHSHTFFHLFYLIDGTITFTVGGSKYIMDGGDLLIIPPQTFHEVLAEEHSMCSAFEIKYEVNTPATNRECLNAGIVYKKRQFAFENLLNYVVFNYNSKNREEKETALNTIATIVNSTIISRTSHIQSRFILDENLPENVREMIFHIEENYDEDLNLDSIAKATGQTKTHICYAFKKATGFTLSEYVNYVRIRETLNHLFYTDPLNVPINVIRTFTGFGNVSHFNRVFKKLTGTTPLAFQRLCGDGSMSGVSPLRKYYEEKISLVRTDMGTAFENMQNIGLFAQTAEPVKK